MLWVHVWFQNDFISIAYVTFNVTNFTRHRKLIASIATDRKTSQDDANVSQGVVRIASKR